ncbi:hypothetical protein Tco_0613871 [Tanacetum coccineum]
MFFGSNVLTDHRALVQLDDCWVSSVPFSLSVYLNIKYLKSSLAEDSSASALQALRRSRSISLQLCGGSETEDKDFARALVQLVWQCQAERCRSLLKSLKKMFHF